MSYVELMFRITLFFAMMWSMSKLFIVIAKGVREDKKPIVQILKTHVVMTAVTALLTVSIFILTAINFQ